MLSTSYNNHIQTIITQIMQVLYSVKIVFIVEVWIAAYEAAASRKMEGLHSQTHNIDNNETPNEASPLMKRYYYLKQLNIKIFISHNTDQVSSVCSIICLYSY